MQKFSVLMSLYHKEKCQYLDSCLKSLQQQTVPADEIVIVIDGPISKSLLDTIEIWQNNLPIITIPLEKNVGLGKALNIGLQKCSHSLVARMDTDDYALPQRFEKQIEQFSLYPELILIGSNVNEFECDLNKKTSSKKIPLSMNDIKKYSKKRNPFNHMTVMFKKEKIITAGGYLDHPLMEDYNLWLRCLALNYQMANIESPLVNVRAGNEMVSRRKGVNYLRSEYDLFKLKNSLKTDSVFNNFRIFLSRALLRLIPLSLLRIIYSLR